MPLAAQDPPKSYGSLFVAHGQLDDYSADLRDRHVNDVVTILISTKTPRSLATARPPGVLGGRRLRRSSGPTRAAGPLSALPGWKLSIHDRRRETRDLRPLYTLTPK